MTEPTARTLDVPGAVLHYDIRTSESTTEPPLLFGSPMPASGFVTLASHFTDRTAVTYAPRVGSQQAHRWRRRDHARRARRRSAPADLRAGCRAGEHLRDQRRGRQRARPRGQAPRTGPHARRARTARRPGAAGSPDSAGSVHRHPPDLPEQRLRPGDGEVDRARRLPRAGPGRLRTPASLPTRLLSGCPRRTMARGTTRSSGRTCRAASPITTTSTRCARHRPASCWFAERVPASRWPPVRPPPWPDASGRRPPSSRAPTTGSSGGEYGSTGKPEAFAAALCGVLTEVAAELAQDRTARCCGTSVRT